MLIDGIGSAALDYGTHLPAAEVRRWACDAQVIPVVLGGKSEILHVGRAMRTVPAAVRRALVVRDKGCASPGFHRPPSRCSAHHKKHWIDGGETSVGNPASWRSSSTPLGAGQLPRGAAPGRGDRRTGPQRHPGHARRSSTIGRRPAPDCPFVTERLTPPRGALRRSRRRRHLPRVGESPRPHRVC